MKRIITIGVLLLIMYILIFLEDCIGDIKLYNDKEYFQRAQELENIVDDTYFENWKYIVSFTTNKKQKENIEILRKKLEEDLRKNYNVETCKIKAATIMGNVISFEIHLENY